MVILKTSHLAGFLVNMWRDIIIWLGSVIPNYAWAIVLLTIAIKLLMSPLDYFNKKVSRKNTQMQKIIQPQLEKIKTQYGHDAGLYNQKTNELYRANNYNVLGSCLFMLINLALTLTVFISLLNAMNLMASDRITAQYDTLSQTYYQTLTENQHLTEEQQIVKANQAVSENYQELKDSWLWIENIWKSDTITNSIPNFDEYIRVAKTIEFEGQDYDTKKINKQLNQQQIDQLKQEYETVMGPLRQNSGQPNGYYILVVLVVGTSILAQWLSQRKLKTKTQNPDDPSQSMNKMMMLMLPVLFGVFALSSTAMFSLYLVTSQIIAIMLTPFVDFLIDKGQLKAQEIRQEKNTPEYSRDRVKQVFEPKQARSKPESEKSNKGENK